jgi:serine/threonine protein kinase
MTALLDKLKVGGNGRGSADVADDQAESDEVPFDTNPPMGDHRGEDAWLEATQHDGSPMPGRSQIFTYPPGSTPLPRYTIRRGIGMGGFGEVYFAISDAGKEVAIKRIQRNLEVELRGVSHCLNLKHPNLVSIFDICRDAKDQYWVVMEYISGPNLRQVLDDAPKGLPPEEVRRWFHGIAAGVHHLHSAGLVHRDLKPGNVFDDLGTIKVGDYGLSKFISASHRGGHTESVGTFHYMAPEIGRGQYGREIDIYALGVMLFELMTGHVPFDGESCHEIIVKHLTAMPDLQEISEPYRSTIAKCLQKDPARRFASVMDMMESLGFGESRPSASRLTVASPIDSGEPRLSIHRGAAEESPVNAELVCPVGYPVDARIARSPSPEIHDEPFARAIKQSLQDLKCWWSSLDRSPGAKAILLVVGAFVLLVNTHWLLPMLSVLAVFYVPYYIVRQMVLHVRQQPSYAEAQRIATATVAQRAPITKAQWRSVMRTDLRAKRSVHRLAEVNTSWITASLCALVMALLAGLIGTRNGPVNAVTVAPYAWMALVVSLGSLAILGLGKLWEREDGEPMPRRVVLAGVGAGVGLAAYSLHQFLMLPLATGLERDIDATGLPPALYADGVPTMSALVAHFALLFAALRWWKPVDPLRRTRLSLWAVAVAVVGEWAVHQILPVPQPAGMLIAGGIAISVQLSAPWISPRITRETMQRRLFAEHQPATARNVV